MHVLAIVKMIWFWIGTLQEPLALSMNLPKLNLIFSLVHTETTTVLLQENNDYYQIKIFKFQKIPDELEFDIITYRPDGRCD